VERVAAPGPLSVKIPLGKVNGKIIFPWKDAIGVKFRHLGKTRPGDENEFLAITRKGKSKWHLLIKRRRK
jgi:hypothetical protein